VKRGEVRGKPAWNLIKRPEKLTCRDKKELQASRTKKISEEGKKVKTPEKKLCQASAGAPVEGASFSSAGLKRNTSKKRKGKLTLR